MKYVAVFLAFFLVDYLNAQFTRAVVRGWTWRAAGIRALYQGILATGLIVVILNPGSLLVLIPGSFLGTYLALREER